MQFPFGRQVLPVLFEILVHIVKGRLRRIQWDGDFWERRVVIVYQCDLVHAFHDCRQIRFEQFAVSSTVSVGGSLGEILSPCVDAPESFGERFSEHAQPRLLDSLHRQGVFLVLVMRFNCVRYWEAGALCLWSEARYLLLGPVLRRRFIRPADKLPLAVQIPQDMPAFIQQKKICPVSREFADERSRPPSGRKRQRHDAVILKLPDLGQTRALKLGPKELTK
jgi:hypothetical protein